MAGWEGDRHWRSFTASRCSFQRVARYGSRGPEQGIVDKSCERPGGAESPYSQGQRGTRLYSLLSCGCFEDMCSRCAFHSISIEGKVPDSSLPSRISANLSQDIFTLFVTSILPALSDPSNAYNTQHMYVLTSLAEVKSIVLLTDVNDSDTLILHLFTSFFDIISGSSKSSTGEQLSKNAEYHMIQILVTLVDEAPALPSQAIDVVVAQFLRASTLGGGKTKDGPVDEKQSTLLVKELPPAYRMAESLCNSCPEKMARYISQYFNDVIMDASASGAEALKPHDHRRSSTIDEFDDDDIPSGPTEADLRELNKAHKLLRELWRASPPVLQNVIPQLEAELSAENVNLRLLATETLGDIISGIGAAGPPPPPVMDPAAYPPLNLADYPQSSISSSILTTPMSPQSFAQAYPGVYQNFLGRKNDKSPIIRSAWTTAISRILTTSAGGRGLSRDEEVSLVDGLAEKLNDADEKVRTSAVKAVAGFGFRDIMSKLTINGGVGKPGSVLCNLADRARDRRHAVRVEGMTTISKIWGVAAGEIAAGNESVVTMLGAIPSKIFEAFYANDQDVNVLLDHVMFEQLIPLSFPPAKPKAKQVNGDSQTSSQGNISEPFDPDRIRTERILVLIQSLEPKSRKAFFAMQARQSTYRNVMNAFLKRCEEYNGGVVEGNAKEVKDKLTSVIQWLVSMLPDQARATADLWKYVKLHDRRSYQLIRFAMAAESDFKTVFKAIKEFSKRIESAPGAQGGLLETLTPLIYRAGSLVYNKSQVPSIMEFSRNDSHGLGATAHELLKELSERNPDVFKAQVKELCKLLEEDAPSSNKVNSSGSVKTLKACASYAQKYPEEIPRDRKFIQALLSFAQFGIPPRAAKYALIILMTATERKELHARDLLHKSVKDWEYGSDHFITKLAALSQLSLLAPEITNELNDDILDITTQQILLQVRTPANDNDPSWQDESDVDEECQAKCWALKILVNRLRVIEDHEEARNYAEPIFKLLNVLIFKEGELSRTQTTPKHHRSRLRLVAAQLMLKLCTKRMFDELLTPLHFNHLALVAQDQQYQVRRGFIEKLQKYLVQGRLPHRFYSIIFLLAFEPEAQFKDVTVTWIRSRAKQFQEKKSNVMESVLPRLLSLLAHHPDYNPHPEDLMDTAQYILFYVTTIANEDNLGLIYKYAQRVKQARDAIKPEESENLYVLSDLAQAVIRKWEDKKGWAMQIYPGKIGLSKDLFAPMPDHEAAQETADKSFLPEEVEDLLDGLIRTADKKKVRSHMIIIL